MHECRQCYLINQVMFFITFMNDCLSKGPLVQLNKKTKLIRCLFWIEHLLKYIFNAAATLDYIRRSQHLHNFMLMYY